MIVTSQNISEQIFNNGFSIVESIYTEEEVLQIINAIEEVDSSNPTFRKSTDLFAIRQFFKEVSQAVATVFNKKLTDSLFLLIESERYGSVFFVLR